MTGYVQITRSGHGKAGYVPAAGFAFARDRALAPLVADELAHASQYLPLALRRYTQEEGTEALEPVALLSLDAELNMMIALNGRWLFGYVPACFRREPFAVSRAADTDAHLLIREDRVVEDAMPGRVGFFAEDGELTPALQGMAQFVQQLDTATQATAAICARLDAAGLLEPWNLAEDPALAGYEKKACLPQGLLRVNIELINGLDDPAIAALQRSGALFIAHLQHASMARLKGLVPLAQAYEKAHASKQATAPAAQSGVGELFGEESDTFSF